MLALYSRLLVYQSTSRRSLIHPSQSSHVMGLSDSKALGLLEWYHIGIDKKESHYYHIGIDKEESRYKCL